MKHMKRLILAMLIAILAVGYVLAEKKVTPKPQTTCPVMGGKIDKNIFADHEGKRVYFCCAGCIPEFQKDPAKHIKKLEGESVTLEEAPNAGLNKKKAIDVVFDFDDGSTEIKYVIKNVHIEIAV